MAEILITSLLVSLGINLAMFLVAFKLQSDKLTDISYAVTFITIALFAFLQSERELLHTVLAGLVCAWAFRLGGFLLYRIIRQGKDSRFDGMRENFLKFGKFWLAQAITVWVLMFPSILAFGAQNTIWNTLVVVGVIVWATGLLIETIADYQKMTFKNKGMWIDTGIWKYSRHPNYFGEILVWLGIYTYVVSNVSLTAAVIGLVSPLFISVLLLFVSGIPILERSADKKWGGIAAYEAYKKKTSILIPLPKK